MGQSRRTFLMNSAASASMATVAQTTDAGSGRPARAEQTKQEKSAMGQSGFSKARLGRMHDVLAGHVASGEVPGLVTLISRHGEVVVDAIGAKAVGGDPVRRDSIFRITSMTKPITAAAAMILVADDDRPVHPRAESGISFRRPVGKSWLGVRRRHRHSPRRRGREPRPLRLGRRVRYLLVIRSRRRPGRHPHDPARRVSVLVSRLPRFLDPGLPGD